MVGSESETLSQSEVESGLQEDQQPKNHGMPSLGRQSSIYSLTLDEFQHTLCENGKNFGSMNMDEFLTSIWTAEENQATNFNHISNSQMSLSETSMEKPIAKQPSLARQGSLSLPAPFCQKTVDEVWSEIHKAQQQQQQDSVHNAESAHRQPTLGEMTLEDFLIRAGVVREQPTATAPAQHQQQHQYGLYQNNNTISPTFARPVMGMGGGAGVGSFQTLPQSSGAAGESSGYAGNGKRNGGYPKTSACLGGRVGNGGGVYGPGQTLAMESTVSPVSSDGMCPNQIDNTAGQFGLDVGSLRGRKRIIDGPVEKVVERRQRRMIKNRESAARSRARKQAYTVELEAELNQLKEENTLLQQALAEADFERKRKQQYLEELKMKTQTKAEKAKEK
ncbi:hypothetical protein AAG906_036291 [Vitis piasezkii]